MSKNKKLTYKLKIKFKQEEIPKVKLEGCYYAVQKTDMLEVVDKIQKERVAKP